VNGSAASSIPNKKRNLGYTQEAVSPAEKYEEFPEK